MCHRFGKGILIMDFKDKLTLLQSKYAQDLGLSFVTDDQEWEDFLKMPTGEHYHLINFLEKLSVLTKEKGYDVSKDDRFHNKIYKMFSDRLSKLGLHRGSFRDLQEVVKALNEIFGYQYSDRIIEDLVNNRKIHVDSIAPSVYSLINSPDFRQQILNSLSNFYYPYEVDTIIKQYNKTSNESSGLSSGRYPQKQYEQDVEDDDESKQRAAEAFVVAKDGSQKKRAWEYFKQKYNPQGEEKFGYYRQLLDSIVSVSTLKKFISYTLEEEGDMLEWVKQHVLQSDNLQSLYLRKNESDISGINPVYNRIVTLEELSTINTWGNRTAFTYIKDFIRPDVLKKIFSEGNLELFYQGGRNLEECDEFESHMHNEARHNLRDYIRTYMNVFGDDVEKRSELLKHIKKKYKKIFEESDPDDALNYSSTYDEYDDYDKSDAFVEWFESFGADIEDVLIMDSKYNTDVTKTMCDDIGEILDYISDAINDDDHRWVITNGKNVETVERILSLF